MEQTESADGLSKQESPRKKTKLRDVLAGPNKSKPTQARIEFSHADLSKLLPPKQRSLFLFRSELREVIESFIPKSFIKEEKKEKG